MDVCFQIGKIYFDAKRECKDDCYVGLPTHIPGMYRNKMMND